MGLFSGITNAVKSIGGAVGDFFDSGAGTFVGSLLGSGAQYMSGRDTNAANAAMAQRQMEFQSAENQKEMADTQYQRGVKDLKKAGLNPMLAYSNGGAAAPSGVTSAGASAVMENPMKSNALSSALEAARLKAQAEQVSAQTENVRADTANKLATASNIAADTDLKTRLSYQANTQGNVNQAQERNLLEMIHKIKADTGYSSASAEQIRSQNLMIKDMMADPALRPFAPILQMIMRR
nr:MAG: DNA pilot protein [Microvirus sp.]